MQAHMCPTGSSPPVRRGKKEKCDTEQKMLKENKGQGNKIWRVFSEIQLTYPATFMLFKKESLHNEASPAVMGE